MVDTAEEPDEPPPGGGENYYPTYCTHIEAQISGTTAKLTPQFSFGTITHVEWTAKLGRVIKYGESYASTMDSSSASFELLANKTTYTVVFHGLNQYAVDIDGSNSSSTETASADVSYDVMTYGCDVQELIVYCNKFEGAVFQNVGAHGDTYHKLTVLSTKGYGGFCRNRTGTHLGYDAGTVDFNGSGKVTVSGLQPNTGYRLYVYLTDCFDFNGDYDAVGYVDFTTSPAAEAGTFQARVTGKTVTITPRISRWNGSNSLRYTARVRKTSASGNVVASREGSCNRSYTPSLTIAGLSNGTKYVVTFEAKDECNNAVSIEPIEIVTYGLKLTLGTPYSRSIRNNVMVYIDGEKSAGSSQDSSRGSVVKYYILKNSTRSASNTRALNSFAPTIDETLSDGVIDNISTRSNKPVENNDTLLSSGSTRSASSNNLLRGGILIDDSDSLLDDDDVLIDDSGGGGDILIDDDPGILTPGGDDIIIDDGPGILDPDDDDILIIDPGGHDDIIISDDPIVTPSDIITDDDIIDNNPNLAIRPTVVNCRRTNPNVFDTSPIDGLEPETSYTMYAYIEGVEYNGNNDTTIKATFRTLKPPKNLKVVTDATGETIMVKPSWTASNSPDNEVTVSVALYAYGDLVDVKTTTITNSEIWFTGLERGLEHIIVFVGEDNEGNTMDNFFTYHSSNTTGVTTETTYKLTFYDQEKSTRSCAWRCKCNRSLPNGKRIEYQVLENESIKVNWSGYMYNYGRSIYTNFHHATPYCVRVRIEDMFDRSGEYDTVEEYFDITEKLTLEFDSYTPHVLVLDTRWQALADGNPYNYDSISGVTISFVTSKITIDPVRKGKGKRGYNYGAYYDTRYRYFAGLTGGREYHIVMWVTDGINEATAEVDLWTIVELVRIYSEKEHRWFRALPYIYTNIVEVEGENTPQWWPAPMSVYHNGKWRHTDGEYTGLLQDTISDELIGG